MPRNHLFWLHPFLLASLLNGCGGGGGSGSSASNASWGTFIDSPVQGLAYQTPSQQGFTDEQGRFKYLPGESVTFRIGTLDLPSVSAKEKITPLDVAGTNDINHSMVTNLLVLLQSLDTDGNASNGITLPSTLTGLASTGLDLAADTDAFQSDTRVHAYLSQATGQVRAPVPAAQARTHFRGSLNADSVNNKLNIAPVAHAGAAQNVAQNTRVQLDASSSSDANADALTYRWTLSQKPGLSQASLQNASSATPSFVADAAGDYVLSLTVSDGVLTDSSSVAVRATASTNDGAASPVPSGYALVWSDEFEGAGIQLPDANKWGYDTYMNAAGWFNGELQYYANARLQNASVQNGKLVITARAENLSGQVNDWNSRQRYTSTRLITKGKATWTYGFFEIRAKLPCGEGTWPAIWTLGSNTDRWPDQGEIDIMEQTGWDKGRTLGTVHTRAGSGGNGSTGSTSVADACTNFHNYQIHWTPTAIHFYVDGVAYRAAYARPADPLGWPFDQPQYLLINVAVGGVLGGDVTDSSLSATSLEVEYVRIYQQR